MGYASRHDLPLHATVIPVRATFLSLQKSMTHRPPVKVGDWIRVRRVDCVVSRLRPTNDPWGNCEAVFNPSEPTKADARWTGATWVCRNWQPQRTCREISSLEAVCCHSEDWALMNRDYLRETVIDAEGSA